MSLPFEKFKCDNCGACCKSLIVEADYLDVQREPRLYQIFTGDKAKLRSREHVVHLYDLETRQCPFLDESCKCEIYNTRPNECVLVEPGDAKCQQARYMQSLPLLRDVDGNEPSIELLLMSCEEYELCLEELGVKVEKEAS